MTAVVTMSIIAVLLAVGICAAIHDATKMRYRARALQQDLDESNRYIERLEADGAVLKDQLHVLTGGDPKRMLPAIKKPKRPTKEEVFAERFAESLAVGIISVFTKK